MTRRHAGVAATALVCCCLPAVVAWQQPPPEVQFESRADLILVDATVVDAEGSPIADLGLGDFAVSIDGRPRQISSAQFVRTDTAAVPRPAARTAVHYSSNEGVSDGRRIVVAVDENSIPPGGARAVLSSVESFLKGLSPVDRIAFIRLPTFEDSLDFTSDHQRVTAAVRKVAGKAHRAGFGRVSIAEAVAFERGETFQWDRALTRMCGTLTGADRTACVQDAESDAADKVGTYQQRARETVRALAQVVENIRSVPGPKTLVLLSQGFLSYDVRPDVSRIAEAAGSARVSLYALYIDAPGTDLDAGEPSSTRGEDERLMAEGIDDLAGASRGTRFRITGTGEGVFARVARELSGYYLLGLEPTDADRDGKPHRIKVNVKRPAATVRSRAQFTIAAGTADAKLATPEAALLELLRAPSPQSGVPLRFSAFATPASTADQVRLIVAAEIGAETASPVSVHTGLIVVTDDGKIVGNQFVSATLRPDGDGPGVPRYVGAVDVPRGSYTIRFAVVDAEGRAGSVHHAVEAAVADAAGVSVSDLMLMIPVPGVAARPEVHLNLRGAVFQALIELTAADTQELDAAQVSFEVAETEEGAPIVSAPARVRKLEGRVQPAAVLDVSALAAGAYVARAVVTIPGHKPVLKTRPFEIAPRHAVTAARAAAGGSSPAPALRGRIRPEIPPFRTADVLAPEVVNPFVDHVLASYSPSPAARQALSAIKAGNLQPEGGGRREVGDVGMSFAQGLAMLAANRPAEADAYFRAALRSASDFIGAAFYLGATLAAAGRDRDAVAAWQTALIGEVGAAGVYPVLIDGLLRLREGEHALDVLQEAEPTFADRSQYERRLAQAYALLGRIDESVPLAHRYLEAHPDDVDMLFLAMQMLYETHAAGTLKNPARELDRFRAYASAYEAAKGPHLLVVQGWRKALGIR